ncbi:MAG: VanZ family protein [Phycisphaerales bacterium]
MTGVPANGPRWLLSTRAWRTMFWCWAVVLFTMTHWPKLRVPGPEGTDLVAHLVSFGTWAFLLGVAAFFPPRFSPRSVSLGWLVGVMYAALDEGLQAIPALGRTCAWSDYGADVLGVTSAAVLLLVLGVVHRRRSGVTSA